MTRKVAVNASYRLTTYILKLTIVLNFLIITFLKSGIVVKIVVKKEP